MSKKSTCLLWPMVKVQSVFGLVKMERMEELKDCAFLHVSFLENFLLFLSLLQRLFVFGKKLEMVI